MKISVTQGGRAVALTVSRAGLRGLPGGPGVPGASLIFINSSSWAQIDALVDLELGDAYILTAPDAAAPERATGDPAEAGDGLQWNGTAWLNIGGPLQGPPGPQGPQGEVGVSPEQIDAILNRVSALEENQLPSGTAGQILVHNGTTWEASTLGETA